MSEFDVLLAPEVAALASDDREEDRDGWLLRKVVEEFREDPYPGEKSWDRLSLDVDGKQWFRRKIGRSWCVFYLVDESAGEVRVVEALDLLDADNRSLY